MRPLARDESAVFLIYLPTVYHFLSRLFALTIQLRPSLYLAGGCNYLQYLTFNVGLSLVFCLLRLHYCVVCKVAADTRSSHAKHLFRQYVGLARRFAPID